MEIIIFVSFMAIRTWHRAITHLVNKKFLMSEKFESICFRVSILTLNIKYYPRLVIYPRKVGNYVIVSIIICATNQKESYTHSIKLYVSFN